MHQIIFKGGLGNQLFQYAAAKAISDFYTAITNKNFVCKSDGVKGCEVVEILEAANKSMKLGGTPVKV